MRDISYGTLVIEADRCKGCELCIPACPLDILVMSKDLNVLGYRYPILEPGCTGCTVFVPSTQCGVSPTPPWCVPSTVGSRCRGGGSAANAYLRGNCWNR